MKAGLFHSSPLKIGVLLQRLQVSSVANRSTPGPISVNTSQSELCFFALSQNQIVECILLPRYGHILRSEIVYQNDLGLHLITNLLFHI